MSKLPSRKVAMTDFEGTHDTTESVQDDCYYDAMEHLCAGPVGAKQAERLLKKALKLDESNVQTWVGLANVYGVARKKKKAHECIRRGYEETIKRFPKWPRRMEWSVIENRRHLRALHWMGELLMDTGETEKGVELLRRALKLNPGDNQGIRYILAGHYAGISGDEVNHMFDEGNAKQDWSALERMVVQQNKLHKFWKEPKYN